MKYLKCRNNISFIHYKLFVIGIIVNVIVTEESCVSKKKIDLFYLQDNTLQFGPAVSKINSEMSKLFTRIDSVFLDSTYGAAVFSSVAKPSIHSEGQYCYDIVSKLKSNYVPIVQYFKNKFSPVNNASDNIDHLLSSLSQTVESNALGWRNSGNNITTTQNEPVPIIIAITDGLANIFSTNASPSLNIRSTEILSELDARGNNGGSASGASTCTHYPSVPLLTLAGAIERRNGKILIFTPSKTLKGWEFIITFLTKTGSVSRINSDGSGLSEAVLEAIEKVLCGVGTNPDLLHPEEQISSERQDQHLVPVVVGGICGGALLISAAGYSIWKMNSKLNPEDDASDYVPEESDSESNDDVNRKYTSSELLYDSQ